MNPSGKQLHLNVFVSGTGHHEASWRHPQASPERNVDVRYFQNIAQIAERGKLDSLFLADSYVVDADVRYRNVTRLEPLTLLSALSVATERIGLIATAATTYNDPFHIARKFASLDHISGGRAGWNIVTAGTEATSFNFGRDEHLNHALRYKQAEEFVEVVTRLWDSWDEDALVIDKEAGLFADGGKVREIHFKGDHYAVRGPLNLNRPPQGYPVLVQAGSSESGKELAAKTAEVIFTAVQTLAEAQQFYSDVKSRLAKYGRTHDQLTILPGLSPIIGDTEAEAKELEQSLQQLTIPAYGLARLSRLLGTDMFNYDLDGPVPIGDLPGIDAINGRKARYQLLVDLAVRENLTIRQLILRTAGARGHLTFTGTPLQVADLIENWFKNGGSDGFNVMPPLLPLGLEAFVDKVVPELQNRGLFRTDYEGTTLRDHLGLTKPVNKFSRSGVVK
ncbi:LLM class flavin-dependent oxidoreductase [Paenibacillus piri]|uniref:LLM class flavin-dependent oxidoreductase n=1 Tax=Paenibacillus piri TaxID=2547395 RepID=A0A4R5KSV2_9BACL|nr:LLM class flavin-dependent oxidoreductase [Paenibacillus piri]